MKAATKLLWQRPAFRKLAAGAFQKKFHHILTMSGLLLFSGHAPAQNTNADDPRGANTNRPATVKLLPSIKAEALWDGRKLMPFKAMDFPVMVKASEAGFLEEGDYVLGVTIGGQSRAYPTRYIWFHHVVNDKVADPGTGRDVSYAVTYCSVCNTGICYDSLLNGQPVMLDFYGLYNGVVALCERKTESVFLQVSGQFVSSSLAGMELTPGALLDTTWGRWKQLHPDTLVMSPDTAFSQFYNPKGKPEPRGYTNFPAPFFRPTVTHDDHRLPPFDKILGVSMTSPTEHSGKPGVLRRAYPLDALAQAGGAVNDTLGGVPVAVLLERDSAAANAVGRVLDGRTLTLAVREGAFVDEETGTQWSLEGRGEKGPLAGKMLPRVDNHLSQWYGWAAYYPETSIFGRADPLAPANLPGHPSP
jgi:hypothetical protein